MARTLKVFRTAIGFHDAYVAAPSMKAALAAWGADTNLFASGMAEQVTDEALTAEPLASPGKVVKRTRGSVAEHLAALPKTKARPAKAAEKKGAAKESSAAAPRKVAKPAPRPSRAALDAADDALAKAEQARDAERRALAQKEAALQREKAEMERRHGGEIGRLAGDRDAAQARYDRAMEKWRG